MSVQSVVVLNGEMWKDFSPRCIQSFFTEGAVTTEAGCLFQYFTTLTSRYLRTYDLNIIHKPTESRRSALRHMKLCAWKLRNMVHKIPRSSVRVGVKQAVTRMKEHKGAVMKQDENSLQALHCLITDHALYWAMTSVIGADSP